MADTTTPYRPGSYRRVCDTCGMLRQIEDMRLLDGSQWGCTYDEKERTKLTLDRGNARQRGPSIKAVPHPKPQDQHYPNVLETDDAAVFNFLAQQVEAECRYEYVESGAAPATDLGEALPTMGWAARYYYDLIQQGTRLRLIPQAKVLLAQIADFIQTRQRGFGLVPAATRANDLYYGGVIESGADVYITNDTATCGLALLYAYRVHGSIGYLAGARAAASYLRNVQAIGKCAEQFTASNSAGTARLYTGAVVSEVSTAEGIDPGQAFYSNHLFYASDLVALELWNELKTTDGDQSVGCTAVLNGFLFVPAQLLSECITDMRACWEVGINDATATRITGLSATTPREYFNAFPAAKAHFDVIGTGMWEFVDGDADTGTQVTAQTFAQGLSSLYNYEGASSQVTGISDWLRTFTANAAFETPDDVSTRDLYRSTTGTYDPTVSLATLLTVRDAGNDYAAVKTNGSSVYDWGAFGLLSRLWASRYTASFRESRLIPLSVVQRYYDGTTNDSLAQDRVALRGVSGLTLQSAATTPVDRIVNAQDLTLDSPGVTEDPSMVTGEFWFEADQEITLNGLSQATAWGDLTDNSRDVTANNIPWVSAGINDLPSLNCDGHQCEYTGANIFVQGEPRTTITVCRPALIGDIGGYLICFRRGGGGGRVFGCGLWTFLGPPNPQYLYTNGVDVPSNILRIPPVDLSGQTLLIVHAYNGSTMTISINGVTQPVDQSTPGAEDATTTGFILLRLAGVPSTSFRGLFSLAMCHASATAPTDSVVYAAVKYGIDMDVHLTDQLIVNDAVRAAQFGRTFREAH